MIFHKFTFIHCLIMGIHSKKCIIRWFCHCKNVIEYTYTNLDIRLKLVPFMTNWKYKSEFLQRKCLKFLKRNFIILEPKAKIGKITKRKTSKVTKKRDKIPVNLYLKNKDEKHNEKEKLCKSFSTPSSFILPLCTMFPVPCSTSVLYCTHLSLDFYFNILQKT